VLVYVIWAVIKETPNQYNLSCLLQTYCHLSTNEKLFRVSRRFSDIYGVINYGRGWRKDAVNQCLEFDTDTDKSAKRWT